jgi:hypothetical protein
MNTMSKKGIVVNKNVIFAFISWKNKDPQCGAVARSDFAWALFQFFKGFQLSLSFMCK